MNSDEVLSQLRRLTARAEIADCMQRYARGMDRHDPDLVRSAYHDDAIDDHVGFVGGVDDFIDWAFSYHNTQAFHQHYLMNHSVEVDGDQAHAETYYLFVGTDRDVTKPLTVTGGRYVDRLECRGGRWGIVTRVCLVEWMTNVDSGMSPQYLEFLAPLQTVAHDRSDASYLRPLRVTRV